MDKTPGPDRVASAWLSFVATFALAATACVSDTLPTECVPQEASTGADPGRRDGGAGDSAKRDSGKSDAGAGNAGASRDGGKADARSGLDPSSAADAAQSSTSDDSGQVTEPPNGVTPDEPGACADGYTRSGDKCACDLHGTFAFHGKVEIELSGQAGVEDGRDTTNLWAIVQPAYTEGGKLSLAITDCGQATPDVCGVGSSLLVNAEAYAQYSPAKVWRKGGDPAATTLEMSRPEALPATSFVTPEFALLRGISLDDPAGEWPSTRRDIDQGSEFDGTATNGARWVDEDGDDAPGVTNYVVPPGGISASGSATAPADSYGATSPTCPRSNPSAARSPYAYLPVLQGITLRRIKRIHQATRVTTALNGRFDSCDRISGELQGPNDGAVRIELRVGGCVLASGSNETPCDAALLDLAEDSGALGAGVLGPTATFVMQRVSDDISCAEVRTTDFE